MRIDVPTERNQKAAEREQGRQPPAGFGAGAGPDRRGRNNGLRALLLPFKYEMTLPQIENNSVAAALGPIAFRQSLPEAHRLKAHGGIMAWVVIRGFPGIDRSNTL